MAERSRAHHGQERWGSRLGIILAVAGSAVGLGNYLRFPVQAAQNGGGAFMIPYFVALLLLGIPLSIVEWTIGRHGGAHGHNTAAGAFQSLWSWRGAKYLGLVGVFGPWVIFLYYVYVESWTLAYSYFAMSGLYGSSADPDGMTGFLKAFQGLQPNGAFANIGTAYFFFLVTFGLNLLVLAGGIRRGIEFVSKVFLPMLFLLSVLLVVQVFWLGAPAGQPEPEWNRSVMDGLGYLWNPDFSALGSSKAWLAAAGQILFTLSVGIGAIVTYASYLKENDDVTLSSLSAAGMNELAEVVIGGCLVIPAAFAFYGAAQMTEIARGGSFNLGFVTMPLILNQMPWSQVMGFAWFFLLFLAGITSSISLAQPVIAFFQNVYGWSRTRAITVFGLASLALCQPAVLWLGRGAMDEMDFWGGTFCLVLFAAIEIIVFAWVFGMERGWREIHRGALVKLHPAFKFIIRYLTPAYLLFLLVFWVYDGAKSAIGMQGVSPTDRPYVLATRWMLIGLYVVLALSMRSALRRRHRIKELAP